MTMPITAPRQGFGQLARFEATRFARHPLFLIGCAANAALLVASMSHASDDIYGPAASPAIFVGLLGMVVAFRLTQSMHRAEAAVASTPSSPQQRVGALLAACAVPAVVGLASFLALLAFTNAKSQMAYGAFDDDSRYAIWFGQTAVACLGGPLLGIAVARWVRFPGAVLVLVTAVVTWVICSQGWPATRQDSVPMLMWRVFTPFGFFTTIDDNPKQVESWRGSPWWFLAWLLVLCVLAALVALLRDAQGPTRTALLRGLGVVAVLGVVCYGLTVTGGFDHPMVTGLDGITTRLS
jgi:hypothetical protein